MSSVIMSKLKRGNVLTKYAHGLVLGDWCVYYYVDTNHLESSGIRFENRSKQRERQAAIERNEPLEYFQERFKDETYFVSFDKKIIECLKTLV
jgi:hypothetical protein